MYNNKSVAESLEQTTEHKINYFCSSTIDEVSSEVLYKRKLLLVVRTCKSKNGFSFFRLKLVCKSSDEKTQQGIFQINLMMQSFVVAYYLLTLRNQ